MTTLSDQGKPSRNKLADNALPILAVVVLVLALVFAKGAVFALRPLLKFAIPGGIAYVTWRWVKRKFVAVAGQAIRQKMEDAMRGGPQGRPGAMGGGRARGQAESSQVIDLCPQCGTYLKPGHRCAPKA